MIKQSDSIIYIVEGETEKKLITAIKNSYIYSGKIYVRNLVQNDVTNTLSRLIKPNSIIIIVFDTDVNDEESINKLGKNIRGLSKHKSVKKVILIPQISNLEEELIYSTNMKQIKEFTKSKSNKEFKSDFLAMTDSNVPKKLNEVNFDIKRLWSRNATNRYKIFTNESELIKKKH